MMKRIMLRAPPPATTNHISATGRSGCRGRGGLLFFFLALLSLMISLVVARKNETGVTYDERSLIINGNRELLFSGSIHYTRCTPDTWPGLIRKARDGGLNVIDSYVFWNAHEPVRGQFNFEGQYDLVRFLKLIRESGLYVTLRLGPFIQAEWNHGGLPYWLREVPNIIFRSDNPPFKYYMKKWVTKVVNMLKKEKLFASQGGPIILAQIENEYNSIQLAYKELGTRYVQWAGNMAVGLNVGVPWVMCKQFDAPDPIINACNGRHCGDTFVGPNKPYKPALWTENWTAQYRVFGDPPSQRAAEDLSFSVARFFSKNGALVNYYMYYGGTNFGRTTSAFTTTRYYDEAPIDEYGLYREPKWSHLRDLHRALSLCKKPLLRGNRGEQRLSVDLEARWYELPGSDLCAAFLTNNNTETPQTINFRGNEYLLPPRSISILPDCKTVVYNTKSIVEQHNSRSFRKSEAVGTLKWNMYKENVPTMDYMGTNVSKSPLELYGLLKDTTDYAWYTTKIQLAHGDLPMRKEVLPVLRVASLGHAMIAFVNGEFIGAAHGSHVEKSFVFEHSINLKAGVNQIAMLCMTVGLPDSGAYMEHRYAGPKSISILGLTTGTLDLTINGWVHQVGLDGEKMKLFSQRGLKKVKWTKANPGKGPALAWYKAHFDAPEGDNPVAVRVNSMSKGMIWINGLSIGRYWVNYLSPLGAPTQSEYHIPRSYINKAKNNLIVVLDEQGGDPSSIEIVLVDRDTICSYVSENYPPTVFSWERKEDKLRLLNGAVSRPRAHLSCPGGKKILAIEFADFGSPSGACGAFQSNANCTSFYAKEVVEKVCLGKQKCDVPLDRQAMSKSHDSCPNFNKILAIQARCGVKKP